MSTAKQAGNTEIAADAIRQIRGKRLWKELGFTSFNEYAKSDACPYSSNYAYKMSAAPTDPLQFVPEDRTNQAPQCIIEGPVTDLRGNELHGDLAELFTHAGIHFDILNEAIHKMRDTLRDLVGVRSGARFSVHSRSAGLMKHLHDIEAIVHDSRPYSICISCSGNRRQCIACGGVGFITKSQYEDATTRRRR